MPDISMKNMLEAGVHFGHQTHRWNPKMKPFIYGPRNGIYIIDLEKTVKHAREACTFVRNTIADGGKVLFVATKKQAKDIARDAAVRANMPFVTDRWLGGTLTNFQTIRRGCERLDQLDRMREDGTYQLLPKKETVVLDRKRKKLEASLGGVRHMKSIPAALFIIDPEMERIAVREANRLGVPVVAVVDTNCNPDLVDYVIPGNDDAIKSVTLFVNLIADACLEGGQLFEQRMRSSGAPQQHAASAVPGAEGAEPLFTAGKPAAGPIIERVARKQVRNIPAEFDPRTEDMILEEELPEEKAAIAGTPTPAEGEGVEAASAAEATPAEAAAPADKPAAEGKAAGNEAKGSASKSKPEKKPSKKKE